MEFLKLFLEHPDRLEKLIINVLRFLITYWVLSFIVLEFIPFSEDIKISPEIDLVKLSKISTFNLSLGIILFIITWVLLWWFLAILIIPFLIKVIGFILLWSLIVSIQITVAIVQILVWPFTGKKKLPKFFRVSRKKEDSFSRDYSEKQSDFNIVVRSFDNMNRKLKSSAGSEALLYIIEHEKAWFVKSRVHQYYAIVLFICAGFVLNHSVKGYEVYFVVLLVFLFILGVINFTVDYIFEAISNINQYHLVDDLSFHIYTNMVKEALEDHRLLLKYDLTRTRSKISLRLKKNLTYENFYYPQEIHVTPVSIYSLQFVLDHLTKKRKDLGNKFHLIICDQEPTTEQKNRMVKNNFCFIYAEDEEDVLRGVDKLQERLRYTKEETIAAEAGFFPFY
ncbi:MAG: hypothetical protein ACI8ZM_004722 [Crocinitomix sp.]|jgi:hypothetical protein